MVYLTGGRTWYTVVEIADALLSNDRLSGESLAIAIGHAVVAYYDQPHELDFAQALRGIRGRILSRGSEPFERALDKAVEAWP